MKTNIIKAFYIVTVLSILITTMAACGNTGNVSEGSDSEKAPSILPSETTVLSLGIYDDNYDSTASSVKTDKDVIFEPGVISSRMLWGNWVIQGSSEQEDFSATDKTIDCEISNDKIDVEVFPLAMNLGTIQTSSFGTQNEGYSFSDGTYAKAGFNGTGDDTGLLGFAFDDLNGDFTLDCIYNVEGNTFAIGILENEDSLAVDEKVKIKELDYTFEWNGPYLTLHYGDESATYVPEIFESNGNQIIVESSKVISHLDGDNIIHMTIGTEDDSIETKYGVSIPAEYSLGEDGTLIISDELNNVYDVKEFYFSGQTLSININNETSIFDTNGDPWKSASESLVFGNLNIAGSSRVAMGINYPVKRVLSSGFVTDANMDLIIPSRQTVVFDTAYNGCVFHVKAINRKEKDAPVSECTVASIIADLDSGDVSYEQSFDQEAKIGTSTYLDVKDMFSTIYHASDKQIIVKFSAGAPIERINLIGEGYGSYVIENSSDGELGFLFEDDVLTGIRIEIPQYMHRGLNENVDADTLLEMDDSEMDAVMDLRDNVLAKLRQAFDDSGLAVEVDPQTGVIRMASDILFETGEYDVSEEGKIYISSILDVVGSVVLENDVRNILDKVEIAGHTDINGEYDRNYVLSVNRANAVMECYMDSSDSTLSAEQKKQFEELVDVKGYSFSNPVFDEEGKPDDDKSRRVEVRFFVKTGTAVTGKESTESDAPSVVSQDIEKEEPDASSVASQDTEQEESDASSAASQDTEQEGADASQINEDLITGKMNGLTYSNEYLGLSIELSSDWNYEIGTEKELKDAMEQESWYQDFSCADDTTGRQIHVLFYENGGAVTEKDIDELTNSNSQKVLLQSYEDDSEMPAIDLAVEREKITIAGREYTAMVATGNYLYNEREYWFKDVYCVGGIGHYQVLITFSSLGGDYTNELNEMCSAIEP